MLLHLQGTLWGIRQPSQMKMLQLWKLPRDGVDVINDGYIKIRKSLAASVYLHIPKLEMKAWF